jgi:uncharacterized cupin superfamily protein
MQSGVSFGRLEPDREERFQRLRADLGVESFGLNLMRLEPGQRGRIHRHARQEEVYLVLEGELTLELEGEEHAVGPLGIVRVAPEVRRRLSNRGRERVVLLAIGGAEPHEGRDGEAFEAWDEPQGRPPAEVPLPPDLPLT